MPGLDVIQPKPFKRLVHLILSEYPHPVPTVESDGFHELMLRQVALVNQGNSISKHLLVVIDRHGSDLKCLHYSCNDFRLRHVKKKSLAAVFIANVQRKLLQKHGIVRTLVPARHTDRAYFLRIVKLGCIFHVFSLTQLPAFRLFCHLSGILIITGSKRHHYLTQ